MSDNQTGTSDPLFDDIMAGFAEVRRFARGETELCTTTLIDRRSSEADDQSPNYAVMFELPDPPNSVRDVGQLCEVLLEGVRSPKHDVTNRTVDELRAELLRQSASSHA